MTGAIIIIGAEVADLSSENALCAAAPVAHVPYWFVEVLGCSLLERTIQNLRRCGIEKVSILVDKKWKDGSAEIGAIVSRPLRWVENAWATAEDELRAFQADGIDRSLMMSATSYAELDLAELLQFHDEQKKDVTTVSSRNLPLDFRARLEGGPIGGLGILKASVGEWAGDAVTQRNWTTTISRVNLGPASRPPSAPVAAPAAAPPAEPPAAPAPRNIPHGAM